MRRIVRDCGVVWSAGNELRELMLICLCDRTELAGVQSEYRELLRSIPAAGKRYAEWKVVQ